MYRYNEIIGNEVADMTHLYGWPDGRPEIVCNVKGNPQKNSFGIFKNFGHLNSRDSECLGTRSVREDGTRGDYEWKSYDEVYTCCIDIGRGLLEMSGVPLKNYDEPQCKSARMVGVYAINREEWMVIDLACAAFGFTLVPLYATLGDEGICHIITETEMTTIAADRGGVEKLLEKETPKFASLKFIVCFDEITEADLSKAEEKKVSLVSYAEVMKRGSESSLSQSDYEPSGDTVSTVCYTSGTTGVPKGVIQTHSNFTAMIASAFEGPLQWDALNISSEDVHLSYLPLAHVFERVVSYAVFSQGAQIGFFSGEIPKLTDDMIALRPTLLIGVPRVFNRINDKVIQTVEKKNFVSRYLFRRGLSSKRSAFDLDGSVTSLLWDSLVFNKVKNMLGGRVRYFLSGGAPLNPDVQKNIQCMFSTPLVVGYGMTETLAASFLTYPSDPNIGHIGCVFPSLHFRLKSIPEMGYNAKGNPPRGELLLKGSVIFKGYFKNEDETKQALVDGWLHTGDVAEIGPACMVRIIDRKKSLFKLSQGEYISPERLEGVYSQSTSIAQIYVSGLSSETEPVAIIVPEERILDEPLDEQERIISEDLMRLGSDELKKFERVKRFSITDKQFTVENKLLTPSLKLIRSNLAKEFEEEIRKLYSNDSAQY